MLFRSGGTAHNVIPDKVRMRGTLRTLSPENRARLQDELRRLASGIASAHGMSADVAITPGFPVTVCDARAVDLGERVATELGGAGRFHRMDHPIMGAEDFSYVLEKVPGAMFFLGVSHEGQDWRSCCGIHSPRMVVDEAVLPFGAALLAGCAERFLSHGFE